MICGAETSPRCSRTAIGSRTGPGIPLPRARSTATRSLDLFPSRIVGHTISNRITADLDVAALRTTLDRHEPAGVVIVHADRGSQFRARSFQRLPKAAGHQNSMGRVTSAGDNPAMESLWVLLQHNVLNTGPWRARAELHHAITYWIEHTCNRRTHQRGLGRAHPDLVQASFHKQHHSRSRPSNTTHAN